MKTSTLNNFKEAFLLAAFLILLFSFSNKSFGNADKQLHGVTTEKSFLHNKATVTQSQILKTLSHYPTDCKFLPFTTNINVLLSSSQKHETQTSLFLKHILLQEVPKNCRLYYLLCSHKKEAIPTSHL